MVEQNEQLPMHPDNATPPETPRQKSLAETINELDPSKVEQIMGAFVKPFQKEGRQARRDIMFVFGGMLFLLIILLTVMAFMKVMDASAVIFFYGTAFGYLMGFLTKFFIKD
ncbi:MAG: hypothetical protein ABR958_03815 [Dehalococcoidales bacterium]